MRPPFVIIEGPDCTGKTTLSHYLARVFGGMLFHATASGKLPVAMSEYQSNILDNAKVAQEELNQAVVLDRHWPSEHIYGPIFRPGNPYGFQMKDHSTRIMEMGGIYIFCDRKDVVEAHRKEQDSDHPYDDTSFKKVVEGYRLLLIEMHMAGMPVIEYDFHIWGNQLHEFARLITSKSHALQSRTGE